VKAGDGQWRPKLSFIAVSGGCLCHRPQG
jgi:hypothetical protein